MSAPSCHWPATVLGPLLTEVAQAHAEWHTADVTDRATFGRARLRYLDLRQQAAREFAGANGWQAGARPFSPKMLREGRTRPKLYKEPRPASGIDFDHSEFFNFGRIPVAILVHNYTTAPKAEGLRIEQLPESWYWPGGTTAWLIRR
jgi:hypothetical protein